jgi:hypothetical protein
VPGNLKCRGCYSRAQTAPLWKAALSVSFRDRSGTRYSARRPNRGRLSSFSPGGAPVPAGMCWRPPPRFPKSSFGVYQRDHAGRYLSGAFRPLPQPCPVLSIEGGQAATTAEGGEGVYLKLADRHEAYMNGRESCTGASVTVHKGKPGEGDRRGLSRRASITRAASWFLHRICSGGCGTKHTGHPARRKGRSWTAGLAYLRVKYGGMLFISFPGDEKESGRVPCRGRGFSILIRAAAPEPCPFSPYSTRMSEPRA